MKITRVVKTGSVPELTVHSDDEGKGGASPTTFDCPSSPDEARHPWWAVGSSSNDSLKSYDDSRDLVLPMSSRSTSATPRGMADGGAFAGPMAKRGRLFASRLHKRRLVQKNGECNVRSRNVMKRKRKYIVDIFTTLVDMRWRYHLLLFALAFIVTWFTFGAIWYGI